MPTPQFPHEAILFSAIQTPFKIVQSHYCSLDCSHRDLDIRRFDDSAINSRRIVGGF
jgi:hypothetical protein